MAEYVIGIRDNNSEGWITSVPDWDDEPLWTLAEISGYDEEDTPVWGVLGGGLTKPEAVALAGRLGFEGSPLGG